MCSKSPVRKGVHAKKRKSEGQIGGGTGSLSLRGRGEYLERNGPREAIKRKTGRE